MKVYGSLKDNFMRLAQRSSRVSNYLASMSSTARTFQVQQFDFCLFDGENLIPKQVTELVSRDSATFPGVKALGLACDHQKLVKLKGPKDT
jgi:hypothetical protein